MLRRLAKGGFSNVAAGMLVAVTPFIGALYLSAAQYSFWILGATLGSAGLVLDLGSSSLATRVAALGAGRRQLLRLTPVACCGSLIVSGVAFAFWPAYSMSLPVQNSGFERWFILVIGISSALRMSTVVGAGFALGRADYRWRAYLLLSGPLAQLAVTWIALRAGCGLASLVLGMMASAGLAIAVFGVYLLTGANGGANFNCHVNMAREVLNFATSKGVGTFLGLLATQFDRWFLALLLSPVSLQAYDLSVRVVLIPKAVIIALGVGTIREALAHDGVRARSVFVSKAYRLFGVAALILAVSSSGLLWIGVANGQLSTQQYLAFCAPVLIAHALNVLTIPGVMINDALGRPGAELAYLLPFFGLAAASYVTAFNLDSSVIAVFGWSVALSVTSGAFYMITKSQIRRRYVALS